MIPQNLFNDIRFLNIKIKYFEANGNFGYFTADFYEKEIITLFHEISEMYL